MLASRSFGKPERDGRVALRVEVDEQRAAARLGDAGGEVDGGRGLPHAALLICHRIYSRHRQEAEDTCARGRSGRRPAFLSWWFGSAPNVFSSWPPQSATVRLPNFQGRARALASGSHPNYPSTRASGQGMLAGRARAAGEPRRREAHLLVEVEIVGAAARKRVGPLDAGAAAIPTVAAAASPAASSAGIALSLPRDQPAAGRQQRGRVLDQGRQRRERAGQHGVVAPRAPSPRGPVLGARVHDRTRSRPSCSRGTRSMNSHLAAAPTRPGRTRRPGSAIASGRPGKPAPLPMSATARRRSRASSTRGAREAVRDVHERSLGGVAHRRGGARVVVHERQQRGEPALSLRSRDQSRATASKRALADAPPRRVSRVTALSGTLLGRAGRSGVITIRRKGSSPSLCVSTSTLVLQVVVDDLALLRRSSCRAPRAAVAQRVRDAAVGLALEHAVAPLAVAARVDHHLLAVLAAAKGGLRCRGTGARRSSGRACRSAAPARGR